jgi:hypothetical protein
VRKASEKTSRARLSGTGERRRATRPTLNITVGHLRMNNVLVEGYLSRIIARKRRTNVVDVAPPVLGR